MKLSLMRLQRLQQNPDHSTKSKVMTMTETKPTSDAVKLRLGQLIAAVTLSAIGIACTVPRSALAEATGTNQNVPGLADTPGTKSTVLPVDHPLSESSIKFQNGLALLNSAVLLKVYFYAYSGIHVDYSEILTENTDNIVVPRPVQATDAQKKVIDRLIQIAKTHPAVLIKVDDIVLDEYDKPTQSYPIVNRLFVNYTKYYFDNSPYHYFYADAGNFRNLHCPDAKIRTVINAALTNYEHFLINIEGVISTVVAKDKALIINLHKVTLMNSVGGVLITEVVPERPVH